MSNRGRFLWHELMTTDTTAAKAFYGDVIGWKTLPPQGPMDYVMFALADTPSYLAGPRAR